MNKQTNIMVWVVQVLLAMYYLAGGAYSYMNYHDLIWPSMNSWPPVFFMVLSGLQVVAALGIIVPGIIKKWRQIIPLSAAYLAVSALIGCVVYIAYAGFPGMLWGVIPAILAAYVAYARRDLRS